MTDHVKCNQQNEQNYKKKNKTGNGNIMRTMNLLHAHTTETTKKNSKMASDE